MRTDATRERTGQRLHQHYVQFFTGDGAKTEFLLARTIGRIDDVAVYVAGSRKRPDDAGVAHDFKVRGFTAGYDGDKNAIKFAAAPALNADICVEVAST